MPPNVKSVPRHIAIIMDGNGRWAKGRGLPRIKGHEAGAQAVRECVEGCGELKVEYLTLYAFSAENWQRPKTEVLALMRLLEKFLKEKTPELIEKNVRLQAIGRLTDLPASSQEQLHKTIEQTAGNTGLTLILALSYGGRLEIIDGIKSLLRAIELGHIDRAMIDVEMFSKHLYTRYYPDPDLLIRKTVARFHKKRSRCRRGRIWAAATSLRSGVGRAGKPALDTGRCTKLLFTLQKPI